MKNFDRLNLNFDLCKFSLDCFHEWLIVIHHLIFRIKFDTSQSPCETVQNIFIFIGVLNRLFLPEKGSIDVDYERKFHIFKEPSEIFLTIIMTKKVSYLYAGFLIEWIFLVVKPNQTLLEQLINNGLLALSKFLRWAEFFHSFNFFQKLSSLLTLIITHSNYIQKKL